MNLTLEEIQHVGRYNLQFIQTSPTEHQLFLRSDIFGSYSYPELGGYILPVADFKMTADTNTKYALYNTYNAFKQYHLISVYSEPSHPLKNLMVILIPNSLIFQILYSL